ISPELMPIRMRIWCTRSGHLSPSACHFWRKRARACCISRATRTARAALLIDGSNHDLRAESHGTPHPEAQIGGEQFETMQPRHYERLRRLPGLVEPKEQQHQERQQQSKRCTVKREKRVSQVSIPHLM